MRTTVRLDEHLLRQAKQHAAASGMTLTAVLEQALRESLARRAATDPIEPVRLKTFRGGGVRPGVDLDDSASLLDLMVDEDETTTNQICSWPGARSGGPAGGGAPST
jgi:hypothetical protein